MLLRRILAPTALVLAALAGAALAVSPIAVAALAVAAVFALGAGRVLIVLVAQPRLVAPLVALFSLVLLRAPMLVNNGAAPRLLALVPFVAGIMILGRRGTAVSRSGLILIGAYLAGLALVLLRGTQTGAYASLQGAIAQILTFAVVAFFAVQLFATVRDDRELRLRLHAVALAPAIYAAVNLLLWFGGVDNGIEKASIAEGTNAQLLGMLGFSTVRVSFPLGVSINNFGAICGVGLAACVVLFFRDRGIPRSAVVLGAAACVLCMLLGDSRVALFTSLLIGFAVALFPRMRAASGLAILAPLAPLVIIAALGYLAKTSLGDSLSGTGRDLSTGSGRGIIWSAVWEHLSKGNPQDFIGYGAGGHQASGVSENYAQIFGNAENAEGFPTHNVFLQTIMDGGYIGLVVLVALFVFVFRQLADRGPESAALLAGAIALLLAGMTEVTPTYYAPETVVFLLFAAATAAVPLRHRAPAVAREPTAEVKLGGPRTVSPAASRSALTPS